MSQGKGDKPTCIMDIIGGDEWENGTSVDDDVTPTDASTEDVVPDVSDSDDSVSSDQIANEGLFGDHQLGDSGLKETSDLKANISKLQDAYKAAVAEASNGDMEAAVPDFQVTKLRDTYRINVSGWSWAFDDRCNTLVSTVLMSLTKDDHVVIDYMNIGGFPCTEYQIVRGLASHIVACKATVHMDFPFLGSLADLVIAMSADTVNIGDGASLSLTRHFSIDNVSTYAKSQHKLITAVFKQAMDRKIISPEEFNMLCTDVDARLLVMGADLKARFAGTYAHPVPSTDPVSPDVIVEDDVPTEDEDSEDNSNADEPRG